MGHAAPKKENLLTGIIGAVLGAAIGCAIWVLVARAGYIISLVGFVIAFLASFGYDLFRGPKSNAKVVILILCVILAVVGANYINAIWEIDEVYETQYGALNAASGGMSLGLAIPTRADFRDFMLSNDEVSANLMENIGKGLLYAGLGCVGVIVANVQSRKKNRKAEEAAAYEAEAYAAPEYTDEYAAAPEYAAADDTDYGEGPYDPMTGKLKPGWKAPAATESSAATYRYTSMRTSAGAASAPRTAASAPRTAAAPAAKKSPFVKPEFANDFNTGKAQTAKQPSSDGAHTFYSDK